MKFRLLIVILVGLLVGSGLPLPTIQVRPIVVTHEDGSRTTTYPRQFHVDWHEWSGGFFVPTLRAAASLVQSCYASAASPPITCVLSTGTTGADVTAGNALVIFCQNDSTPSSMTATDDRSNSYTEAAEVLTGPTASVTLAYDLDVNSGATTGSCDSGGTNYNGITMMEITGQSTSGLDGSASITNGSGNSALSPDITTSNTGITIAVFGVNQGGAIDINQGTTTGTWTQIKEDESWSAVAGGSAYIVGTAGTKRHGWTNGSGTWRTGIMSIAEGAGGGGGGSTPNTFNLLGVGK